MTDMYEQLTNVYYQLLDKAHDAREASYCPYSGFAVGAALLTASGKIYLGANIENASYSPTMCAERVAFFKAISAGEREFVAIAIVIKPVNSKNIRPLFSSQSYLLCQKIWQTVLTLTLGKKSRLFIANNYVFVLIIYFQFSVSFICTPFRTGLSHLDAEDA